MNNLELADKLQDAASNHYGNLCGMLWDAGAALRNLHTENMALRCTEMALRDELEALNLAPSEAEPVAWICEEQSIGPAYGKKRLTFSKYYSDNPLHYKHTPLYTHPAPQQKPLTDEQIQAMYDECDKKSDGGNEFMLMFARAIEAAHNIGEKK